MTAITSAVRSVFVCVCVFDVYVCVFFLVFVCVCFLCVCIFSACVCVCFCVCVCMFFCWNHFLTFERMQSQRNTWAIRSISVFALGCVTDNNQSLL